MHYCNKFSVFFIIPVAVLIFSTLALHAHAAGAVEPWVAPGIFPSNVEAQSVGGGIFPVVTAGAINASQYGIRTEVQGQVTFNLNFHFGYSGGVLSDTDQTATIIYTIDGIPASPRVKYPYVWTWNSTTVSDGSHVAGVIIVDGAGDPKHYIPSATVLIVDNVPGPVLGSQMLASLGTGVIRVWDKTAQPEWIPWTTGYTLPHPATTVPFPGPVSPPASSRGLADGGLSLPFLGEAITQANVTLESSTVRMARTKTGHIFVDNYWVEKASGADAATPGVLKEPLMDGPRDDNRVSPYSTYTPDPVGRGFVGVDLGGRVFKVNIDGSVVTIAGRQVKRDIVPYSANDERVTEADRRALQINMVGNFHGVEFNQPNDLAYDPRSNGKTLYVADTENHRIAKVDLSVSPPNITTYAGDPNTEGDADASTASSALFTGPSSLVVAADGTMYVADYDNNNIRKIAPNGGAVSTLASGLNEPFSVRFDSHGNLDFIQLADGKVMHLDVTTKSVTTIYSPPCAGQGWVWLDVDRKGNLGPVDDIFELCGTNKRISADGTRVTDIPFNLGHYPWVLAIDDNEARVITHGFGDTAPTTYRLPAPTDPSAATLASWNQNVLGTINNRFGYFVTIWGTIPEFPVGAHPAQAAMRGYTGHSPLPGIQSYDDIASLSVDQIGAWINAGFGGVSPRPEITGRDRILVAAQIQSYSVLNGNPTLFSIPAGSSDVTPPVVSNVQVTQIDNYTAKVTWDTNEPTLGYVRFGPSTTYFRWSDIESTFGTSHSVTLQYLPDSSTVHFAVVTEDQASNFTGTPDHTFTSGIGPAVTFTANPTYVAPGQSTTLSWSSTGATSCAGTGFSASGTSGSVSVSPTVPTTYTLSCTNAGGTTIKTITPVVLAVSAGNIGNGSFETPALNGQFVVTPLGATWNFSGPTGIEATGSAWGAVAPPSGAQAAFIQASVNPGKIVQAVSITNAGTYAVSFYAAQRNGYPQYPFSVTVDGNTVGSFTPSSASFTQFTTSSFNLTTGVHTIAFVGSTASVDEADFIDVVTLTNGSGVVPPPTSPTATLSASPTSITAGQSSTLTWSSTNTTNCSGTGFTASGTSGSLSVSPTVTTTYTITCTGSGGSTNASATVTVGAAPAPAPTATLTASLTSITAGQSSTLTWSSTNTTSCTGTNFTTPGTSGSVSVSPTVTTTYTLSCTGSGGTTNKTVTVTVAAVVQTPTATLSASPTSITAGQSSTLTWSSTNTTSCSGTGFTPSGTSGSVSVSPTVTTTYTLSCTGSGGTANKAVTVAVNAVSVGTIANASFETPAIGSYVYNPTGATWTFNAAAGIEANGSAWNAAAAPDGIQAAFIQASGNPGSISQALSVTTSGSYTLAFKAAMRPGYPQYPFSVTVDGTYVGSFTPSSTSFTQFTTNSFTLSSGVHTIGFVGSASSVDESDFIDMVTLTTGSVTTPPPASPTVSLTTNPTSITAGQSATLNWSSTDATSCTGVGFTASGTSGSVNVTPTVTTTYTITCIGSGGSSGASATVTVGSAPPVSTPTITPTVTLTISPDGITAGQSATLSWESTNTTSCSGTGFTVSNTSGSTSVTPVHTATYSITCSGPGGSATVTATVYVDTAPPTTPTTPPTTTPPTTTPVPVPTTGPIPSTPGLVTIIRSLYYGLSGTDVTALQNILVQKVYLHVAATGYFGPLTREAVRQYQCDMHVVCSGSSWGLVGPLTKKSLGILSGSNVSTPAPISAPARPSVPVSHTRSLTSGMSGSDVTALQNVLIKKGYLDTAATGSFDADTKRAVQVFQCSAHIACTGSSAWGIVGPLTKASLVLP